MGKPIPVPRTLPQISPELQELFDKEISIIEVRKGTLLQQAGALSVKAFIVKKGLLRSYIIDSNGREHNFVFAPEGWFITDVELFSKDKPAVLYVDALEDSVVEVLSEKVFENTNKLPAEILTQEITKLINRINALQKRVLMLLSASAEERYLDFIKTYPQIVQRIPQKMIASYLGITPEALSKIRRQMAQK